MIKIFKGSYIYIERDQFSRDQILKSYKSPKKYEAVKFVIKEKNHISSVQEYKDILLKREFSNNLIEDSEQTFEEARKYFQSIENLYTGCCVGVISKEGNLNYILEYFENTRFIEPERQPHFYAFNQYNYAIDIKDKGIRRFLESSDCFVFESMEEYTVHIAKLLLQLNKIEKKYKLYSLDVNVKKLFSTDEIAYITDLKIPEKETTYIMVISDRYAMTPYKQTEKRSCYKSLEIMTLFYGKQVTAALKPKTQKQFVILQDEYINNGLVDLMKHNMTDYILEEYKGNIPIINAVKNVTYTNLSGENAWNYYLQPMNEYTLDEAYASNNYVIVSRELRTMAWEQEAEYAYIFRQRLDRLEQVKRIQWKKEILEYCKSELPAAFLENKRILGVMARGTDLLNADALGSRWNSGVEKVIELTKKELQKEHYDFIYLATEDLSNYRKFQKEFGTMLIASEQERFDSEADQTCINQWIATLPRANGGFEYGLDYLVVIYCLSQCESLISSMESGAYLAATAMNQGKYKKIIIATRL